MNEEAQDYVWAALDEALTLPIDRYTARAINALVSRRSSNGK